MQQLDLIIAFLLLIATIILWWFARSDLNSRAAEKHAPTVQELEKVRAAVEDMLNVLEERAGSVERRLSALIDEARTAVGNADAAKRGPQRPAAAKPIDTAASPAHADYELKYALDAAEESMAGEPAEGSGDDVDIHAVEIFAGQNAQADPDMPAQYGEVYTLFDQGVADPVEIARRTGLGQAEVEMVLSLRVHPA